MNPIESLSPEDWPAALECALGHVPADERRARIDECLHMLANGLLDARSILVTRENGKIVAGQVFVLLRGSACALWLPGRTDEHADALVRAVLATCRMHGCKFAQAVAKPGEEPWTTPLVRCGFNKVTRLQHWRRDLIDLSPPRSANLRFEPYRSARHVDFAATLERTYEGTLDCPELNGVRRIDEIIEGHQAQGTFHPDFWWLAHQGDRPVGVILLAEMPDSLTWELAYLGIVPEFRGQRLAGVLLSHAMEALRNRPALHVVLAVDERNVPARRLYASFGFVETEVNEVFLFLF